MSLINTLTEEERNNYITGFTAEIKTYSFEPRKNGEPRNSGSVHELENIDEFDVTCPEDLAKLVKEGLHLMYQKQTAARVMNSLLEYLQS